MNVDTAVSKDYEQTLIQIVRNLPRNRVEQLIDFARFLETQLSSAKAAQEEDAEEIKADNARWDALLATDEAQMLLEELANEALEEHRAGRTKKMVFNDEGRITPE